MHVYTKQYTRREGTQYVYVENLEKEKPRESSNSNYRYVKKIYNRGAQRQRPRAHYLRLAAVTTETQQGLSLSLCLSVCLSYCRFGSWRNDQI